VFSAMRRWTVESGRQPIRYVRVDLPERVLQVAVFRTFMSGLSVDLLISFLLVVVERV
jgi:predicted permease